MLKRLQRLSGWWALAADGDTGNTDPAGTGDKPTAGDTNAGEKQFTQADIDRIVGRETKKAAEKARAELEAEHKKAAMDETERLKAEKVEAEQKAADALSIANQRLIQAAARVTAVELGIKPERVAAALKLADLSGVAVGDGGEPDAAAIKTALEAVLKELPELKAAEPQTATGGSDFANGQQRPGDKPLTEALIADMDPKELARRMPEIERFYAAKRR